MSEIFLRFFALRIDSTEVGARFGPGVIGIGLEGRNVKKRVIIKDNSTKNHNTSDSYHFQHAPHIPINRKQRRSPEFAKLKKKSTTENECL